MRRFERRCTGQSSLEVAWYVTCCDIEGSPRWSALTIHSLHQPATNTSLFDLDAHFTLLEIKNKHDCINLRAATQQILQSHLTELRRDIGMPFTVETFTGRCRATKLGYRYSSADIRDTTMLHTTLKLLLETLKHVESGIGDDECPTYSMVANALSYLVPGSSH